MVYSIYMPGDGRKPQLRNQMTVATIAQAEEFAQKLTQRFEDHKINGQRYYDFSCEVGRKYVRVVINAYGQRHVYCFVRIEDGAILKAASWKTPAKGVRAWLSEVLANDLDGVDQYTRWLYRKG